MLKKFLQTNLFYDNEYLHKYLDLCTSPINSDKLIKEIHHIFPRAASSILQVDIDNSPSNLVELDIKNHCLAHYYLALCSKNNKLRFGNMMCLQLITHRNFNEISEQWIMDNLYEINTIRLEQRKLNSELQVGKQAGEKNGNCRYSKHQIDSAKELLLLGKDKEYICDKTGLSKKVLSDICSGRHWSCKEDGFRYHVYKPAQSEINLKNEILEWQKTVHFCKNCGKELTEYLRSKNGDGCFCSKHCSMSFSSKEKYKRDPELAARLVKNRNYKGENNPNFGKTASIETRKKISLALKNSEGVKNSPRFRGCAHTDESKKKTSESVKAAHCEKPNWRNK